MVGEIGTFFPQKGPYGLVIQADIVPPDFKMPIKITPYDWRKYLRTIICGLCRLPPFFRDGNANYSKPPLIVKSLFGSSSFCTILSIASNIRLIFEALVMSIVYK